MIACVVAGASAACSVDNARTYVPSGPSALGLSLTLQASPDVLPRDGGSQSLVVLEARRVNNEPARGLSFRAEISANGIIVDHGSLSAKEGVIGSDGRATLIYTAPLGPRTGNDDSGDDIATIRVTPVGDDYSSAVPRTVDIRLVPLGMILPPNSAPVPDFSFSPASPREADVVQFDASASKDEGTIVSYRWDFGDGTFGSGMRTTHAYMLRGEHLITLTVTDDRGATASKSKTIEIAASAAPTVAFTVSPTRVGPGEAVFFNASATQAAPGRQIVSYSWAFGDGGTGLGVQTSHRYGLEGNYNVVLTVTDDAGKTGTATAAVQIGAGLAPVADFTWSPTSPTVNQVVNFNATLSKPPAGRTIQSYHWNFGDGTTDTGATPTHRFSTVGEFSVVLTVTDSAGASSTRNQKVTVK